MNKNFLKIFALTIVISVVLSGCKKETVATDSAQLTSYSNFKENTAFKYDLTEGAEGGIIVFPDFIDAENKLFQIRTVTNFRIANDDESETLFNGADVEVYKFTDDKVQIINDYRNFFNFTDMTQEAPFDKGQYVATTLTAPIKTGTTWISGTHREGKNIVSTITNDSVEVTVPFGTFKAIEVTSVYEESTPNEEFPKVVDKMIRYFVKDVGMVKMEQHNIVFNSEEKQTFVWELSEVVDNLGYTNTYRFYYPLKVNDAYEVKFEEKQNMFKTNDSDLGFFQEAFTTYNSKDAIPLISDKVKINSIKYNDQTKVATIDLSKEFISEMVDDVNYENSVIQSIVNTLGVYYNIPDVIINIDGGAYKSKNISMEKDEIIKIYLEESAEDAEKAKVAA